MSGSGNPLHAAMPSSPIVVDAPNGEARVEWRRFFLQLWNRTGGPQGSATPSPSTPLPVAAGGTGATSGAQALVNLGAVPTTSDHVMVWG